MTFLIRGTCLSHLLVRLSFIEHNTSKCRKCARDVLSRETITACTVVTHTVCCGLDKRVEDVHHPQPSRSFKILPYKYDTTLPAPTSEHASEDLITRVNYVRPAEDRDPSLCACELAGFIEKYYSIHSLLMKDCSNTVRITVMSLYRELSRQALKGHLDRPVTPHPRLPVALFSLYSRRTRIRIFSPSIIKPLVREHQH